MTPYYEADGITIWHDAKCPECQGDGDVCRGDDLWPTKCKVCTGGRLSEAQIRAAGCPWGVPHACPFARGGMVTH